MKPHRKTVEPGLYALTPAGWESARLLAAVDQALAGGIRWLQYREKPKPDPEMARALLARCRAADVPLIINDDVELAAEIGADGIHLGRDDADPAQARQKLGPGAIIGVSCYNDLARAEQLAGQGVDYLAFGAVFASPTKPEAAVCPLELLGQARRFGLPVVAIGGISAENAPQATAAGADLLAVISDVFESPDIQARVRAYRNAFPRSQT